MTDGVTDAIDFAKSPKPGHYAQATLDYRASRDFSLGMGLAYKEKGFRLEEIRHVSVFGLSVPVGARIDMDINALEIPVFIRYRIPNPLIEAYVTAGGGYSFNLNSTINTRATLIGDIDLPSVNISYLTNGNEVFGSVGLGFSKNAGLGKIFGEVKYEQSFENYTSDLLVDIPLKNRGFTVGVGYSMPLN